MKKKWYEEQLRIVHASLITEEELKNLDPGKFAADIRKSGYNSQHLEWNFSWDGANKDYLFNTRKAKRIPRNLLADYLPLAHKNKIKVFIYINVHWAGKVFIEENSDWLQRTKDGKILQGLYGGKGSSWCVNSPWRDYLFEMVEELAKNYEIDGIFLDGPSFYYGTCYCQYCQNKFEKRYGIEMPTEEKRTDPSWEKFIDFRYDSIAEFLRDVNKSLKRHRPNAPLYMNSQPLSAGWMNGRDNRRLIKHQDILGAEGGFIFYGRPIDTPLWKVSATAKLLETQAKGKPTVIFSAANHKPWEYPLTSSELKLLISSTVVNGANPWLGFYYKDIEDFSYQAIKEELDFFASNKDCYTNTSSLAKIAILWSPTTADYYGAELPEIDFMVEKPKVEEIANFQSSFSGGYEALLRNQEPFDVLDEEALLQGRLNSYRMLLLPDVACMSEKIGNLIEEFVARGGALIATNQTSLYNESGLRRKDFLLADLFGCSYLRPRSISKWDLIHLESSFSEKAGLKRTNIPSPAFQISIIKGKGKPVAYYFEKTESRYGGQPNLTDEPAIILNNYGKGKVIYLAGNWMHHYWTYRLLEYQLLLGGSYFQREKNIILQNSPSSVEITVRGKRFPKQLLIHLINYTGEMERPIKAIIPIKGIKIMVRTKSIKSAKALRLNQNLKFKREGKYFLISLPKLTHHETIVLKMP